MARTPLLHALQQLTHDFAEADSRNIPVEEVQEQRRSLHKQISKLDYNQAGFTTGGNYGASYAPDGPYTTSDNDKVQQYAGQFLRKLEEIWPGISSHYTGIATLSYPTGDPNLLGSYSCWLVGQYTTIAGHEKVRQGNIHFAGEHCSYNFQGYMEGGAREGRRAANEILSDYRVGNV